MISQSARDTCISKKMGQFLPFVLINAELLPWFRNETLVKSDGQRFMGKNKNIINIVKSLL